MAVKKKAISAVMLPGWTETPDKAWFPWLHKKLEDRQIRVWAPYLPDPLNPVLAAWMKAVQSQVRHWDGGTIIIGHSIGGVLALRVLAANPSRKVRAVILVGSPFAATVPVKQYVESFSFPIDWQKLRKQAELFIIIHSKDDPLVPCDHAFRYAEALGGKLVMTAKHGHFKGKTAPPVWKEIERII